MARSRQIGEIVAIQYLRGIAAIAVAIHHMAIQIPVSQYVEDITSQFSAGVDLFFVISGFVIAWSLIRNPALSPAAFFVRRLVRILPLYWLITAMMVAVLLIAPQAMRTARLEWAHALASFLFIPSRNPATGAFEPLAIPGWTLNYEMAFYLVFAIAIWAGRGVNGRVLVLAGLTLVAAVALGQWFQTSGVARFYTSPIVLEFGSGMALGWLARSRRAVDSPILSGIALLAMVALFWPEQSVDMAIWQRGIPATIIVAVAAWIAVPEHPVLRTLGDASYSIYLSHIITVAVVAKLANALHLMDTPARQAATLAIGIGACIAVGVAVWYIIERPLTRHVRDMAERAGKATRKHS